VQSIKFNIFLGVTLVFTALSGCSKTQQPFPDFLLGADLSYVNEMEDCGGVYREKGQSVDAYKIFAEKGANIVRLRLWHKPEFGNYASLSDVEKSIKRAKSYQQKILLNFHYSDNWADPQKQIMPAAWRKIKTLEILGDSVKKYTFNTLVHLNKSNLAPDFVQVGNETNIEIIQHPDSASNGPINWKRNSFLLGKGLEGVDEFNKAYNQKIGKMLHIAQPENAEPWFEDAFKANLKNYDWIGLSYYPKWSKFDLTQLGTTIKNLKSKYNKRVMIVETGYPYSIQNFDQANNMLDNLSALKNYPISHEGQLSFMLDLKNTCRDAGCEGIIYWEPAWISTKCKTQWGVGSHWENAAFFDAANRNEALPVFKFFKPNF
jgi:arabinogalactan endo-1,4-beta-galactosidase